MKLFHDSADVSSGWISAADLDGLKLDHVLPRNIETLIRLIAHSFQVPLAAISTDLYVTKFNMRENDHTVAVSNETLERFFHLWSARMLPFSPEQFKDTKWAEIVELWSEPDGILKDDGTPPRTAFQAYRREYENYLKELFDAADQKSQADFPDLNLPLLESICSKPRIRLWPNNTSNEAVHQDLVLLADSFSRPHPLDAVTVQPENVRGWKIKGGVVNGDDQRNLVLANNNSATFFSDSDAVTTRCDVSFNTISLFVHQGILLSSSNCAMAVPVAQPNVNHRNLVLKQRIHNEDFSRVDQKAGYMATLNYSALSEKLPFYKGKMIATPYVATCIDATKTTVPDSKIEACVLPNASYSGYSLIGSPVATQLTLTHVADFFRFFFDASFEEYIDLSSFKEQEKYPGYVATAALSVVMKMFDKKFSGLDSSEQWLHLFHHITSKLQQDNRLATDLTNFVPRTLDLVIKRTRILFSSITPIRLGIIEGLGRVTATIYEQMSLYPESREEECTGIINRLHMLTRGSEPIAHLGIAVSDLDLICVDRHGRLGEEQCSLCRRHSFAQQNTTHSGRTLTLTDVMIAALKDMVTDTALVPDLRSQTIPVPLTSPVILYINRFEAARVMLEHLLHNEALHDYLLHPKILGDPQSILPKWWSDHVREYADVHGESNTVESPNTRGKRKRSAGTTRRSVNWQKTFKAWTRIQTTRDSTIMAKLFQEHSQQFAPEAKSKGHLLVAHFWRMHLLVQGINATFHVAPRNPVECLYYLVTQGLRIDNSTPPVEDEEGSILPQRRNPKISIDSLFKFIENQGGLNVHPMTILDGMKDHGPPSTFYRKWGLLRFMTDGDSLTEDFNVCVFETIELIREMTTSTARLFMPKLSVANTVTLGQLAATPDLLTIYNELGPWICTLRSKLAMKHSPILYRFLRYDISQHILGLKPVNNDTNDSPSNVPVAILIVMWLARTSHIYDAVGRDFMPTTTPTDVEEFGSYTTEMLQELLRLSQLQLLQIKPTWKELLSKDGCAISATSNGVHVRCPEVASRKQNGQTPWRYEHSDTSAPLDQAQPVTVDDFRTVIQFNRNYFDIEFFKRTSNIDGFSVFEAITMIWSNHMPHQAREPPFDKEPYDDAVFKASFYVNLENLLQYCNLRHVGEFLFRRSASAYQEHLFMPLFRRDRGPKKNKLKNAKAKWEAIRHEIYGLHYSAPIDTEHVTTQRKVGISGEKDATDISEIPDEVEMFTPLPYGYVDPAHPEITISKKAPPGSANEELISDTNEAVGDTARSKKSKRKSAPPEAPAPPEATAPPESPGRKSKKARHSLPLATKGKGAKLNLAMAKMRQGKSGAGKSRQTKEKVAAKSRNDVDEDDQDAEENQPRTEDTAAEDQVESPTLRKSKRSKSATKSGNDNITNVPKEPAQVAVKEPRKDRQQPRQVEDEAVASLPTQPAADVVAKSFFTNPNIGSVPNVAQARAESSTSSDMRAKKMIMFFNLLQATRRLMRVRRMLPPSHPLM